MSGIHCIQKHIVAQDAKNVHFLLNKSAILAGSSKGFLIRHIAAPTVAAIAAAGSFSNAFLYAGATPFKFVAHVLDLQFVQAIKSIGSGVKNTVRSLVATAIITMAAFLAIFAPKILTKICPEPLVTISTQGLIDQSTQIQQLESQINEKEEEIKKLNDGNCELEKKCIDLNAQNGELCKQREAIDGAYAELLVESEKRKELLDIRGKNIDQLRDANKKLEDQIKEINENTSRNMLPQISLVDDNGFISSDDTNVPVLNPIILNKDSEVKELKRELETKRNEINNLKAEKEIVLGELNQNLSSALEVISEHNLASQLSNKLGGNSPQNIPVQPPRTVNPAPNNNFISSLVDSGIKYLSGIGADKKEKQPLIIK